jgi:hypothetical protein
MTIPAFFHDKSVQGAIFVFLLGLTFVIAQIRVARQQLFVSLADKRQNWYEAFNRAISDRLQEIHGLARDPEKLLLESEALKRFWRLRNDAIWLFGQDIDAAAEVIEKNMQQQLELQGSFYDLKSTGENPETAKTQQRWMKNSNAMIALRADMRYAINPYLYVGDVRRGWRWTRAIKTGFWPAWYWVKDQPSRIIKLVRRS